MSYVVKNGWEDRENVRPEVAEFALAMEAKLRKNDHKTGWHDQPIEAHIKLLAIEKMELDVALEFLTDERAAEECIDLANFALIIRDKLLARIKTKAVPHACTCHPQDAPPVCQHRYALTECLAQYETDKAPF